MIYLADLTNKEVFENDTPCGNNPTACYDNVSRKFALEMDGQRFWVDKIAIGEKIDIVNATKIPQRENECVAFGKIDVGQRVYDVNGKFLGELENAEFTSKLLLKKLWVTDAEFKRNQILSVGDAIIIRAKTPRQLWLQQHKTQSTEGKPKKTAPTATQNTQTLQDNTATTPIQSTPLPSTTIPSEATPATPLQPSRQIPKRYGNFNFLLGKTVDKTIVNFQGEVMIKKAEKVSKDVLRQAKISGKLIELCLHVE